MVAVTFFVPLRRASGRRATRAGGTGLPATAARTLRFLNVLVSKLFCPFLIDKETERQRAYIRVSVDTLGL